jgi:putative ABC transport system permease protein
MFKSYFKTALRSLLKNKTFSFINIAGLAIGISASLVIYLIVQYDFSFDKFEKDNNRIYRVVSDYTFSGQSSHDSGVPHAMPAAVANEITGVEVVAPFRTWNDGVKVSINSENKKEPLVYKKQKNIIFADENYFKLLQYTWLAGSSIRSLQQAYQVVLSEANAQLYFPGAPADKIVGKEIIFNDSIRTTVTGIVKDLKQNTDFTFKTFISRATIEMPGLKPDDGDEWGSAAPASQLFIKLTGSTKAAQTANQLNQLFKKYYKTNGPVSIVHELQPLAEVHFNSNYDNFEQRIAHKPTLYGLLAVAAFLLLLACLNFINLTTAQASKRAKETGIRKTLGSSKKQLMFQFLGETFLLSVAATVLSFVITPVVLKVFEDFIPAGLHFNLLRQPGVLLFLLLLLLSVSLLSGFYPAIVLSSYKPALVLKGQVAGNSGKFRGTRLRKTLTISQFVIAQVFIIATILVSKQINYTLNKDLGFKKDAIIYFNTSFRTEAARRFVLMNKLTSLSGISSISLSNVAPSLNSLHYPGSILKYKDGKKEIEAHAEVKYADSNYIPLYKIKLLAGTNLQTSDTVKSVIINETFVHTLGYKDPQAAIGKYIEWENRQFPVTGVVADFHQKSLHETIKPVVIASRTSQELMFSIALQPQHAAAGNWNNTIAAIEKAFKEVYPNDDFEYNFLDESIAKYYTAEQHISRLLMWATGLAVFISCLGLLGLVIYITSVRTKEIGIRKVIGATVAQIVLLLSRDFLQLIVIAFIIAIPIAWYGANKWLDNFAYKTNVSWWVFIMGGSIMFVIALAILCLRTFMAARANPVESLRTE